MIPVRLDFRLRARSNTARAALAPVQTIKLPAAEARGDRRETSAPSNSGRLRMSFWTVLSFSFLSAAAAAGPYDVVGQPVYRFRLKPEFMSLSLYQNCNMFESYIWLHSLGMGGGAQQWGEL
jgi:hypothetical protein